METLNKIFEKIVLERENVTDANLYLVEDCAAECQRISIAFHEWLLANEANMDFANERHHTYDEYFEEFIKSYNYGK